MTELDQSTLDKLGIESIEQTRKIHGSLESLKNSIPGFVAVKSISETYVSINKGKYEKWNPDDIKIMSLGIYMETKEVKDKSNEIQLNLIPHEKKFKEYYKRYNGEDLNNKTILIWRTGGIGDILFIQPCMRFIKEKYPTCKIIFACSRVYFPLINHWPWIDEILPMPFDAKYLENSDYHCTFEGVIERCCEAETTNAYKLFAKWMGFDIPDYELKPKLETNKNDDRYVKKIMKKLCIPENNFIYVQPKASVMLRTPSIGHWQRILVKLIHDKQIIVFNDTPELWEEFKNSFEKNIRPEWRKRLIHFSPYSKNISVAMSLMKKAKLVIAPDSSAIHLSAGLKKPCYGIYAPFPGHIRMSTYRNCNWTEPVSFNVCHYGGKNCCLHHLKICPNHSNYISPCFDLLNYTQIPKDIYQLLNKNKKRKK